MRKVNNAEVSPVLDCDRSIITLYTLIKIIHVLKIHTAKTLTLIKGTSENNY